MKRFSPLQLEKIYLKPGELVTAEEPVMITTVLGSCISVTMYHPQTGTALISHAMLPNGHGSKNFKYVDSSIHHMVKYFKDRKIRLYEIAVKLFGGADMFKSSQPKVPNLTVGWQNITVASQILERYDLEPVAKDTGGNRGRKLVFTTNDGSVYIKKMSRNDAELLWS